MIFEIITEQNMKEFITNFKFTAKSAFMRRLSIREHRQLVVPVSKLTHNKSFSNICVAQIVFKLDPVLEEFVVLALGAPNEEHRQSLFCRCHSRAI